ERRRSLGFGSDSGLFGDRRGFPAARQPPRQPSGERPDPSSRALESPGFRAHALAEFLRGPAGGTREEARPEARPGRGEWGRRGAPERRPYARHHLREHRPAPQAVLPGDGRTTCARRGDDCRVRDRPIPPDARRGPRGKSRRRGPATPGGPGGQGDDPRRRFDRQDRRSRAL
ncbi:MAG: hypothetical protein AVDCRST_MAG80-2437, partial [uncultured Rubrobacteraceae bacterium]